MERDKDDMQEDIELRDDEINHIFIKTPGWILNWGLYLILFIVLLFIVGTIVFKYPDTISASFIITGANPPARIKAKQTGRLTKLYVVDNQNVSENDFLAVIENPAKEEDVYYVKSFVTDFLKKDTLSLTLPIKELELGDLQTVYLSFYQALCSYQQFKKNNYHSKKIKVLKDRITHNVSYHNDLLSQLSAKSEQFLLKKKQFKRDSTLYYSKKVISEFDMEDTKVDYLNARLNLLTTNTDIDNLKISMTEMQGTLIDVENDFIEKENLYIEQIKNQALELSAEIQSWEMNYVLKSPIDGKVSFNNYWSEHQNVIVGEDVFNIIPANNKQPVAKAFLPITRSGKVKVNQKVNLHCENFPDNEFGIIKGIVKNISLLPSVSENTTAYVVEITLPNGLVTSYKKELPYYPEMKGKAEIITEDLSLFQRIMFPLRKILVENLRN